jgi:hypothetical protein
MMATDLQIQNLMDSLTNAVLNNENDVATILQQYEGVFDNVGSLLEVIHRLHATLSIQEPSKSFIKHLKRDLFDAESRNRTRSFVLPGRVQVAAGVAAVAGVALIAARRYLAEDTSEGAEVSVLPQ